MIETITPAVCGSRKRQRDRTRRLHRGERSRRRRSSARVLGFAGSTLERREALIAAILLAALAALRELGVVRFPLPQTRRQVPERWQSELPLPLWSVGYGAGLGIGFATFQPVATFWVACAGALALGNPLVAAACLSLYGLGRAVMVVVPVLREPDATLAVERLLGRRPARAACERRRACSLCHRARPRAGRRSRASVTPLDLGAGNDSIRPPRRARSPTRSGSSTSPRQWSGSRPGRHDPFQAAARRP